MLGKFVDRKEELKILEREYNKRGASLIIIFGRRRVGKTTLIQKFMEGKSGIYYLAADVDDTIQISDFKTSLGEFLQDEYLLSAKFDNWNTLFKYLEKVWDVDKKIILAIDEITYIIRNNKSFLSIFQRFWDNFLSHTNTIVIFSGSLVGLMIKEVLSYGSPLYGRRSADIHLQPMKFYESQEFFEKIKFEDRIRYYSILGGIPRYLEILTPNFGEFLRENFFNRNGFFYREGLYLLMEEFKGIATYSNIIRAIADGCSTMGEIGGYVGMDSRRLSSYLNILEAMNIVGKELPVGSKIKRGARYYLKDNLLEFWFKFVHPNRSAIEMGRDIYSEIKNDINSYVGRKFENICKEYIILKNNVREIGRWWKKVEKGKIVEIDVVANCNDYVIVAECKWKDNVDGERIYRELEEKSKYLPYEKRKKYYIFAKSFSKKGSSGEYISLKNLENVFTH